MKPCGIWLFSNFYPRSPCGERRSVHRTAALHGGISIHALLAESDCACNSHSRRGTISIHALLAESDGASKWLRFALNVFLSTLSLRRATVLLFQLSCAFFDFYPRSPCGERPSSPAELRRWCEISIHALLAESDEVLDIAHSQSTYFYPRSPCGERPHLPVFAGCLPSISIHALLAESDYNQLDFRHKREISIHALLAESDVCHCTCSTPASVFLSTLSLRRATSIFA